MDSEKVFYRLHLIDTLFVTVTLFNNNMYCQVFVFSRGVYSKIKERVKSQGVKDIPPSEMNNFFSPFFAEHVGAVKVWIDLMRGLFLLFFFFVIIHRIQKSVQLTLEMFAPSDLNDKF